MAKRLLQIGSLCVRVLVTVLLFFTTLILFSCAAIAGLNEVLPSWASLLIVGGVFLILSIVAVVGIRQQMKLIAESWEVVSTGVKVLQRWLSKK